MHNLTRHADFDKSCAIINEAIEKAATKQEEKIWFWTKTDTTFKMAFLQTILRKVYNAVAGFPTAAGQYTEISHRYKEDSLSKACSAWAEIFKLRCADRSTTIKFTDKFCTAHGHDRNNNGGGQGDIQFSATPIPQPAGPLPATTLPNFACSCSWTHTGGEPHCWFNNPYLALVW
jgi:hypothetical protein